MSEVCNIRGAPRGDHLVEVRGEAEGGRAHAQPVVAGADEGQSLRRPTVSVKVTVYPQSDSLPAVSRRSAGACHGARAMAVIGRFARLLEATNLPHARHTNPTKATHSRGTSSQKQAPAWPARCRSFAGGPPQRSGCRLAWGAPRCAPRLGAASPGCCGSADPQSLPRSQGSTLPPALASPGRVCH